MEKLPKQGEGEEEVPCFRRCGRRAKMREKALHYLSCLVHVTCAGWLFLYGLAPVMGTSGHESRSIEERRRPTDAYQRCGMRVLGQQGRHAFAGGNGTHWSRCLANGSKDDASRLANNGYASHIGLQLPSQQGKGDNRARLLVGADITPSSQQVMGGMHYCSSMSADGAQLTRPWRSGFAWLRLTGDRYGNHTWLVGTERALVPGIHWMQWCFLVGRDDKKMCRTFQLAGDG